MVLAERVTKGRPTGRSHEADAFMQRRTNTPAEKRICDGMPPHPDDEHPDPLSQFPSKGQRRRPE